MTASSFVLLLLGVGHHHHAAAAAASASTITAPFAKMTPAASSARRSSYGLSFLHHRRHIAGGLLVSPHTSSPSTQSQPQSISSSRATITHSRSMVHLRGEGNTPSSSIARHRLPGPNNTRMRHNLPLERPPDPSSLPVQADTLQQWFANKKSVLCLTGAGLSTESGIPDYRGSRGSYHEGHKPVIHDQYMKSETARKRYWGRSLIGYSAFSSARPNAGHRALVELERRNIIGVSIPGGKEEVSIITQNVDNLHGRAGTDNVVNLHGRGDLLRCMTCGAVHPRLEYQDSLSYFNGDWVEAAKLLSRSGEGGRQLRPDGDAEITVEDDAFYDRLYLPPCPSCHKGFLKTDVVFFGDSVPRPRVDLCSSAVDAADGLLCIGTSLAVYSAFRFVRRAAERGVPIAILNVGETRAEVGGGLKGVTKIESPAGPTLEALVEALEEKGQDRREEGGVQATM